MMDFKSRTATGPTLEVIAGGIAALNTVPAFGIRSLGTRVTSYHVVRHLEIARGNIAGLLDAARTVIESWESGDLASAVRNLDDWIRIAKNEDR